MKRSLVSIWFVLYLAGVVTAELTVSTVLNDPVLMNEDGHIPLVINELMASNTSYTGISDRVGDYDDWIELYNYGDTDIDIAGLYLTDDLSNPTRWQIPSGTPAQTMVKAGGYLLIWADGEPNEGPLHADFRLNADGEEIGLFLDIGQLIDSLTFGKQATNLSYGRYPGAAQDWHYMDNSTPSTQNAPGYLGLVDDVNVSPERGFYNSPFEVTLTCPTPEVLILYTLDGTEPTEFSGMVYTPDEPIAVDTTTCLRAAAFKTNYKPSRVATTTYLFVEDVRHQSDDTAYAREFPVQWIDRFGQILRKGDYEMDPEVLSLPDYSEDFTPGITAIPILSIVTDLDNLFDRQIGLFVNNWQWHDPEHGQNWERPISLEYIDPCSSAHFQIDAGIRLAGNQSRDPGLNAKHSMRIFFKSQYGPPMLEFPLYTRTLATKHNTISLRANFHYSWLDSTHRANVPNAHYIRDTFAQDTLDAMGHLSPDSQHVHLFINGLYWGLYQASERPDDSFLAEHWGGQREDYDVIEGVYESGQAGVELKAGLRDSWDAMWDLFEPYNFNNPMSDEDYAELTQYLDVAEFCDYMIYNTFVNNWDWSSKNWYAASRRNPEDVDGPPLIKWTFFTWDAETAMDSVTNFHGFPFSGYAAGPPCVMFNALFHHPDFHRLLGDRIHRHFFNNGALTAQRNIERFEARARRIEYAIIAESARWGDFLQDNFGNYPVYTPVYWDNERDRMINPDYPGGNAYFPNRSQWLLNGNYNSYAVHDFYPDVAAPVFQPHGGPILEGDILTMTHANGSGMIYYTEDGTDPALTGVPSQPVADIVLIPEDASKRVLIPSGAVDESWKVGLPFDDITWTLSTGAPGGVGYERSSGYDPFISLDVEDQMYNQRSSCYVRIPFTVDELPGLFKTLFLNIRYDDGFVAYLNGIPIAQALAPATLSWNASATGNHEANGMETFDISSYIELLRQGANLLAIHGLNTSNTSSDFIISASVSAGTTEPKTGIAETAMAYTEPVVLTRTTHVKARVLLNGQWSALNEAVFDVAFIQE